MERREHRRVNPLEQDKVNHASRRSLGCSGPSDPGTALSHSARSCRQSPASSRIAHLRSSRLPSRMARAWATVRWRAYLALFVSGLMLPSRGATADPAVTASAEAAPSQDDGLIKKTVVSNKLRVIFMVGLEGTGHHFALAAFTSVFQDHDIEQIGGCDLAPSIYLPLAMGRTASGYRMAQDRLRMQMRRLAELEKDLPSPGTFVTVQRTNQLQEETCPSLGAMSYPNNQGPDKALAVPDLQQLAQLAEEEGVDFRIMYLQRSAKALLLSNTSHRGFHNNLLGNRIKDPASDESKFLKYAQIVLADAAAIHSSLSELGPGFVVCNYYDDLGDEDQAQKIADFLSPNEVVAGYLKDALVKDVNRRDSPEEDLPYTDASAVSDRIQRKLNAIEAQHCSHRVSRKP